MSLEFLTVVALAWGAIVALVAIARGVSGKTTGNWQRKAWLRFAGWTVIALEFALAADICRTTIAPSWDVLGKLAVIATIRTLLNFFLARDLVEVRES